MAQVLPELRRVLDGDSVPEGLGEPGTCSTRHRRMVLLLVRTTSGRSSYHRQGRIGTYAIFWNHEVIQVGATLPALLRDDWIFPHLPRPGDRPRARDAGRRRC